MNSYYDPRDLLRFAEIDQGAPELWDKISTWYNAVFAGGALTEREKTLEAVIEPGTIIELGYRWRRHRVLAGR